MNKENLIAKGVKHAFNGQETLFSADSLKEHFDGIEIHEADLLQDEFEDQDEAYVKASDVNFDSAVPKEIIVAEQFDESSEINIGETILEEKHFNRYAGLSESGFSIGDILVYELETPWYKKTLGMPYEEAEKLLKIGKLITLPEWEGFWFANIPKDLILVFTKEGEILETPFDEFKERNDWKEVEATPGQKEILDKYFEAQNKTLENIETNIDVPKEEKVQDSDSQKPDNKEPEPVKEEVVPKKSSKNKEDKK